MNPDETSACEDDRVAAPQGSEEVRQQLQSLVADSLAMRGVSTLDLWTTRPRGQMSDEEFERLERQRANKRRWAQKERARCRSLLQSLRQTNGKLELENRNLKQHVERLRQLELLLRSAVLDHKCQMTTRKRRVVQVLHFPRLLGNVISGASSSETGGMEVEEGDGLTSAVCQDSSDDEPGGKAALKTRVTIHSAKIRGQPHRGLFLPLSQLSGTADCPGQSHVTCRLSERPGTSADRDTDSTPVLWRKGASTETDHETHSDSTTPFSSTQATGQSLLSGGFVVSELADTSKSFLQLLQEDDDGIRCIMSETSTSALQQEVPAVTTESKEARFRQQVLTDIGPEVKMECERGEDSETAVESGLDTCTRDTLTGREVSETSAVSSFVRLVHVSLPFTISSSSGLGSLVPDTPISTDTEQGLTIALSGPVDYSDPANYAQSSDSAVCSASSDSAVCSASSDSAVCSAGKKMARKGVLMDRWFRDGRRGGTALHGEKPADVVRACGRQRVETATHGPSHEASPLRNERLASQTAMDFESGDTFSISSQTRVDDSTDFLNPTVSTSERWATTPASAVSSRATVRVGFGAGESTAARSLLSSLPTPGLHVIIPPLTTRTHPGEGCLHIACPRPRRMSWPQASSPLGRRSRCLSYPSSLAQSPREGPGADVGGCH